MTSQSTMLTHAMQGLQRCMSRLAVEVNSKHLEKATPTRIMECTVCRSQSTAAVTALDVEQPVT